MDDLLARLRARTAFHYFRNPDGHEAADEIEHLRGLIDSLSAQFDHQGCTCTFSSDDCCAFAKAQAALAKAGSAS